MKTLMESSSRRCRRCGRGAITELRYFKEFLCGRCFTDLFEKRVRRTMRVNRLLGKQDKVVVGLSGRRDSRVLLFLLRKIFFKAPRSRLAALTIDDGLPSRVKLTAEFCRRLNVEYHVRKADRRLGVLGTLMAEARSLKADRIALGINLEDEVLYMLEGIMRGKIPFGIKALRGLAVIKPLRECPEQEVELYARINKIEHIKPKAGEKDGFRKMLECMLEEVELKQPGSKFKLLKSVDNFRTWV
ncbi:MAG: hypothetical protein V1703_02565 [Candidatus Altiarchaeota archaeon]